MWLLILTIIAIVVGFNYSLKFITPNTSTQNSNQFHLIRRIQHMGTGLIFLFIGQFLSDTTALYTSLSGFLYFLCVHILRKRNEKFNKLYLQSFKFLLRPHEIEGLPGAFYFLLGVFLCVLFFDRTVTYLSVLFLSFGDPFASICGIYFRSHTFMEGKSVSGTLGCGIACCIFGVIYRIIYLDSLNYSALNAMDYPSFAALCFVISILAEIGPSSRKHFIDDNLTIPLYAGFLFTVYFKVISVGSSIEA